MKWKLDENFGSRTVHIFREAGHDAETVLQEKLSGATDDTLYEVCVREERCLLTLDISLTLPGTPWIRSPSLGVSGSAPG